MQKKGKAGDAQRIGKRRICRRGTKAKGRKLAKKLVKPVQV